MSVSFKPILNPLEGQTVIVRTDILSGIIDACRVAEVPGISGHLAELEEVLRIKIDEIRSKTYLFPGSVLTPKTGRNYLRAGVTAYNEVVVLQDSPLVIVSRDGKYLWEDQSATNFTIIGWVGAEQLQALQANCRGKVYP